MKAMNHRNTEDCHREAADNLRAAVRDIEAAIKAEDGLEWDGALHGILLDAQHVAGRLEDYARMAAQPPAF